MIFPSTEVALFYEVRVSFYLIKHGLHDLHTKVQILQRVNLRSVNNAETTSFRQSIITPIHHHASLEKLISEVIIYSSFISEKARLGEGHTPGLYHSETPTLGCIFAHGFQGIQ